MIAPSGPGHWPGVGAAGYYFTRALERQGVQISYVAPLRVERPRLATLKRRLYRRVLGQRYHADLATMVYRSYARQVAQKLRTLDVELVLSQESGAVSPTSRARTRSPYGPMPPTRR